MKIKLMPLFASVLTLTVAVSPLAAQACNGSNKDKNTSESEIPEQTQSSVVVEENTVTF